jgi:hypothetical protein
LEEEVEVDFLEQAEVEQVVTEHLFQVEQN